VTEKQKAFYDTLNAFGSDPEPPEIQAVINAEHHLVDPLWMSDEERRALH
jgi:hypothetical protein